MRYKFLNIDNKLTDGVAVSLASYGVTSVLMFLANILIARTLGPDKYGFWIIIQTTGYLLAVPLGLGQDVVMVRHSGFSGKPAKVIGNSLILLLGNMLFVGALVLFGGSIIKSKMGIDQFVLVYAFWFGVSYTFKNWGGAAWRTFQNFRGLAATEITVTLGMCLLTAWIFLSKNLTIASVNLLFCISFLMIVVVWLLKYAKSIDFNLVKNHNWFKPLMLWGGIYTITGLTGFLTNGAEKLILNQHAPSNLVGLYAIYVSASSQLLFPFATIFANVLLPIVSEKKNKLSYLQMINRFLFRFLWLLVILNLIITYIIVRLYGHDYPVIWQPIILVTLASSLNLLWQLRVPIMSSIDLHSFIYGTVSAIGVSLLGILVHFLFIQKFGIYGISAGLLTTAIGSFLAQEIYFKKYRYKLE